ncbi:MAG: sulfatase [Kiritimatiellia bacterium]
MNIILVVFDSLRKDSIGRYGQPFWGPVRTPNLDALASESLVMTRAYPESLPTLPTRRALYTGRRVYPFENGDFRLKGDFVGAPGWGPIPEDQPTLAELLSEAGYRTALIADVYHMFKPSKNYWRGFQQWTFLRGQEIDPARSGPEPTREEIEHWLPAEMRDEWKMRFMRMALLNMRDRVHEEDYFNARVFMEAARWLQENRDAEKFFLTVECFDPHEPWFVPEHYRLLYDQSTTREQVCSGYNDTSALPAELLVRTQANYSGLVTMCDRWFGYFMDALRSTSFLERSLLIVTSDHGHSIGDRHYLGKRGYPSAPEVFEVPLIIRHPAGRGAGKESDLVVQHHDIAALILNAAGVRLPVPLDGIDFYELALAQQGSIRDHVTIGWGSAVTVIKDRWWLNCKVDGTGVFLYDRSSGDAFASNMADRNPHVVRDLFELALQDAGGSFPAWLIDLARRDADAPGCSMLVARPER